MTEGQCSVHDRPLKILARTQPWGRCEKEMSREQPEGREDRARQSHSEGEVARGAEAARVRQAVQEAVLVQQEGVGGVRADDHRVDRSHSVVR